MSIRIDRRRCTGCGQCREVCPGNLLQVGEEGKTEIRCLQDCWGCTACVKECRYQAIRYYLGADIGGRGGYLYTKNQSGVLYWHIIGPDGAEKVLAVDSKEANTY